MEQKRNDVHLLLSLLLPPDLGVDALPDGELAGSLADLSQISPGETFGHLGQEGQVDFFGNRALPQVGLQDGHPGALVRQGDVDQLIQTAGPEVCDEKQSNDSGLSVGRMSAIKVLSSLPVRASRQ